MAKYERKSGQVFLLLLAVALYALISFAIALGTADKCGDLDAAKSWNVVPPRWECR